MMRRRLFTAAIATVVLISFTLQAFGFGADKHDAYLEKVLFGNGNYAASQTQDIKDKIRMLEYASYLTLDQVRDLGQDKLDFLKQQKVKRLPKLDTFQLTGIFYGNHRNYTHRGWDYVYPIPKEDSHDKANWPLRKKLLCSTVNKVFDFGFFNERGESYCDQCNSFSALVYYVHVLGDHMSADSYKIRDLTIPFARAHGSDTNPDVFSELEKHFKILFSDQKNSFTYMSLKQEMDVLAEEARTLAGSTGGINTDEKFQQYQNYEEKLMNVLINYVPLLLKNEAFFKNEFYS